MLRCNLILNELVTGKRAERRSVQRGNYNNEDKEQDCFRIVWKHNEPIRLPLSIKDTLIVFLVTLYRVQVHCAINGTCTITFLCAGVHYC